LIAIDDEKKTKTLKQTNLKKKKKIQPEFFWDGKN
jgi:hypothetical protein